MHMGESDIRNYYDHLSSVQRNDLGPRIKVLDEIVIRSVLGSRDPEQRPELAHRDRIGSTRWSVVTP
jgi:hypothetical protein